MQSLSSLETEEGVGELQRLRSALRLSYGPLGAGAVFQPSPGRGHVTLTSLSQRLLPMLRPSSPVGQLLLNSLASHSHTHRDSGLFAGFLTTDLILRGLDLSLPRRQVAMVTSHALSLVASRLEDPSSGADVGKWSLDLSSHLQLSSLLHSLLSSKTAVTQLTNSDIDHLTSLLIKCFLMAVPRKSGISFAISDRVIVHSCVGRPVSQSCLQSGLLLESPVSLGLGMREWEGEEEEESVGRCGKEIVTALFDVSMAGDLPDDFPRDLTLTTDSSPPLAAEEAAAPTASDGGGGKALEVESAVLKQLMGLAVNLVNEGVGFVGCQKVMHPLFKDYCREKGVFVADRLSAASLGPLRELAGGKVISSLSPSLCSGSLGRLHSIRHITVHGKRYLAFEGVAGGRCSLMLTSQTEYEVKELSLICSSALDILQQCLHSPHVLLGGGCTEALIANFLLEKASGSYSRIFFADLQCSERVFRAVMKSVSVCFQRVAVSLEHNGGTVVSDSASHHCWFFPPHGWSSVGLEKMETERERVGNGCSGVVDKGVWKCVDKKTDGEEMVESVRVSDKTCGCGCMKLSDLPLTTKWVPLGTDNCSSFVPDSVQLALRKCHSLGVTECAIESRHYPLVCDPFLPKLRAIETANDLASSILRISFSVSEKT